MEQKYPEPTVGAMIFNPEGKIFLMKSPKWKNVYTFPGGHVELGEKIEDTVKREVKEETGLDVFDLEFVGVLESIFDEAFLAKGHFIAHQYVCKTNSTNVILNEEGEEYLWVSLDEALKLNLESCTRKTIEDYMKRESNSNKKYKL